MYRKLSDSVSSLSGPWLIFIGAFLWSTAGGVTKSFEMDSILLACVRSLLAGLLLSPALQLKKFVWDKWLLGTVLCHTAVIILILSAIRLTTAANALALQFTAPLWIFLWRWLVQRQRPMLKRAIPIGIMLIGIVVMLCEPNTGSNLLGNLLGVCAGAAFAGISVCLKHVVAGSNLSVIAFANICSGTLILIPLLLWPGYSISVPTVAWPYIAFLSIVQLAGGYFFYLMGIKKVSPQKATVLSIWEFILTPVWAFLLVRELPTIYGIIGWVILLIAVLLEGLMAANEVELPTAPQKAA